MNQVVTRFAPSPTGALHIGGARTALFNWAYARRHGGRFIIRVEDTDQARSTSTAARGILADLEWMLGGAVWDEGPDFSLGDPLIHQKGKHGPYFQSQRKDKGIYDFYLDRLLKDNLAYERDGAVCFRMPRRTITIPDAVLGEVKVQPEQLEDFVIRKSDGFPTYHFGVVVDDCLMEVTHVIRGQEHLNNTPKHWALQDAMGFQHPVYAHIPLIFNPDGSKMSKRDKSRAARKAAEDWMARNNANLDRLCEEVESAERAALEKFLVDRADNEITADQIARGLDVQLPEIEVNDFRASGYLPEVLCNYLSLLGWNPGGDVEKFDNEFLASHFDFDRVGKSNSRFDREKLFRFNADAIKALPSDLFATRWRRYCQQYRPEFLNRLDELSFARLAATYQERSRTLAEPCDLAEFFVREDDAIRPEQTAVDKNLLKGDGLSILRELASRLEALGSDAFGASAHEAIKSLAESRGVGMGKVAQPLRVAISGNTVTPPIDATLDILGKPRTLRRIQRCLELFGAAAPL